MGRTFAWIGLGRIVEHHLAALAEAPELGAPVAGCDVDAAARKRFDGRLTTYPALEEMLDQVAPDVLVVATPTPTHAEVCRRVFVHGGARTVLVEKPLAISIVDVEELLDAAVAAGVELRCLYHAAHGPEVEWALANLADELRGATSIESEFIDAYGADDSATYGNSWLDSGINALSIVDRLVQIEGGRVHQLPDPESTFVGLFDALGTSGGLRVRISTSWHGIDPTKVTRVDLCDGGIVILNHQAMLVRFSRKDGPAQIWASSGALPRLTQHYVAALRHELRGESVEARDRLLHTLLLGPGGSRL